MLTSAQGFSFGRREQLLQALVSCLHSLCTMDTQQQQQETQPPQSAEVNGRVAGPMARGLALNSSTNSALSGTGRSDSPRSLAVSASAQQPTSALDRITSGTCGKLVQLLVAGQGTGGAAGGGGLGGSSGGRMMLPGLDPWLSEACLRLVALMTASPHGRKALLSTSTSSAALGVGGIMGCLSTIIANTVTAKIVGGGGVGSVFGAVSASGTAATPSSTPRGGGGGGTPRASVFTSSASASTLGQVATAYLDESSPSKGGAGGGGALASALDVDSEARTWGRCQALASKAVRNIAVSEPSSLLQHRNSVPALLAALLGPSVEAPATSTDVLLQMPLMPSQSPRLAPAPAAAARCVAVACVARWQGRRTAASPRWHGVRTRSPACLRAAVGAG